MVTDYEVLTVSSSPITLTSNKLVDTSGNPKWINKVTLGIETASVRITRTGVNPDNAGNIGHVFAAGTVFEVDDPKDLLRMKFIRATGSDAKVYVEYEVVG